MLDNISDQTTEYMTSCAMEHYEGLEGEGKQRDYLRVMLDANIMMVKFEKKSGDMREMFCTLRDEFIPEHKRYFAVDGRAESTEVLAVWDLEKEDWRSFRIESVELFEYVTDSKFTELLTNSKT